MSFKSSISNVCPNLNPLTVFIFWKMISVIIAFVKWNRNWLLFGICAKTESVVLNVIRNNEDFIEKKENSCFLPENSFLLPGRQIACYLPSLLFEIVHNELCSKEILIRYNLSRLNWVCLILGMIKYIILQISYKQKYTDSAIMVLGPNASKMKFFSL